MSLDFTARPQQYQMWQVIGVTKNYVQDVLIIALLL